jgi:hypothetical protein
MVRTRRGISPKALGRRGDTSCKSVLEHSPWFAVVVAAPHAGLSSFHGLTPTRMAAAVELLTRPYLPHLFKRRVIIQIPLRASDRDNRCHVRFKRSHCTLQALIHVDKRAGREGGQLWRGPDATTCSVRGVCEPDAKRTLLRELSEHLRAKLLPKVAAHTLDMSHTTLHTSSDGRTIRKKRA